VFRSGDRSGGTQSGDGQRNQRFSGHGEPCSWDDSGADVFRRDADHLHAGDDGLCHVRLAPIRHRRFGPTRHWTVHRHVPLLGRTCTAFYCLFMYIFITSKVCKQYANAVADLGLFWGEGHDFGNPTRTEEVWAYERIV